MEPQKLSELIPANLQPSQPVSSVSNELSVYTGELTQRCVVESVATIKKAFPALPIGFYDVFMDMIRETGFTDTRLRDAVKHVICNCQYPQPTIAQFVSFDRRIKLHTYAEYCKLADEGDGKNYQPVRVRNNKKPVWAHVNDINEYKLKPWSDD